MTKMISRILKNNETFIWCTHAETKKNTVDAVAPFIFNKAEEIQAITLTIVYCDEKGILLADFL